MSDTLDPEHHERQAAAHLAAVEQDLPNRYGERVVARIAAASAHATLALALRSRPEEVITVAEEGEPCGSARVLREVEGMAADAVWCPRRSGPCPYPGTHPANDRTCAHARDVQGGAPA